MGCPPNTHLQRMLQAYQTCEQTTTTWLGVHECGAGGKAALGSPGAIALLDFPAMAGAVESGERAARDASARLRELADPAAFVAQLERQRRTAPAAETLRSLRIAGTPRVDERRLRGRVASRAGAPLDLDRLRKDLGSILETGEFDRVDLDFARHAEGVDLAIQPHDNGWGPLYLRGGLNISDDLEGHNAVNLLISVTRSGLNALGAEWRNEFQAGRTRRFFSELYQPLSFGDRLARLG